MMDWNSCGILSCETCKHIEQCCSCRVTNVDSCDKCSKSFCFECLYDWDGRSCGDFSKALCEQCVHDGQNHLVMYCEGYEADGRDVNVCVMCHGQKCNVCCRVLQLVELLQHDGVRRMRDSSRMRQMCQEVL
jgi:hypothetical protein